MIGSVRGLERYVALRSCRSRVRLYPSMGLLDQLTNQFAAKLQVLMVDVNSVLAPLGAGRQQVHALVLEGATYLPR